MNGKHTNTDQCAKGAEWKRRRMAAEEMRESAARDFQACGMPLDTVTSFKYLGHILTASDGNWPAVVGNLRKARKSWDRLSRIPGREGYSPRVSGMFFKAVVQTVLIFGA